MVYSEDKWSIRFSGIVDKLYWNKSNTSNGVDRAKEVDDFLKSVQLEYMDNFLVYNVNINQFDHFVDSYIQGNNNDKKMLKNNYTLNLNLFNVMIKRGFSFHKGIEV